MMMSGAQRHEDTGKCRFSADEGIICEQRVPESSFMQLMNMPALQPLLAGPMPLQTDACTKGGTAPVVKTILVKCDSPTLSGDSGSDTPAHTLDLAENPGDHLLQHERTSQQQLSAPCDKAVAGGPKSASAAAANTAPVSAATPAALGSAEAAVVQPLCGPDPAEGPEAAAEYEAYLKRWAEGDTLAQRWARWVGGWVSGFSERVGTALSSRSGWRLLQHNQLLRMLHHTCVTLWNSDNELSTIECLTGETTVLP